MKNKIRESKCSVHSSDSDDLESTVVTFFVSERHTFSRLCDI